MGGLGCILPFWQAATQLGINTTRAEGRAGKPGSAGLPSQERGRLSGGESLPALALAALPAGFP